MLLSIALQPWVYFSALVTVHFAVLLIKRSGVFSNVFLKEHKVKRLQKLYKAQRYIFFCICQQEEFGAMIACDNPQCPVQWFHFSCVGITRESTGHWYCDEWQLKVDQE